MIDSKPLALAPAQLRTHCDPAQFDFETTQALAEPDEPFGQARAVEALRLGLGIAGAGYNLFVLGPPGSGRHSAARRLLEAHAAARGTPPDWVEAAFDSNEYRSRIEAIQKDCKLREEEALQALGDEAQGQGVALLRTPQGFAFAPIKDGEPLSPDLHAAMPEREREYTAQVIDAMRERLQQLLHELPRMRREMQARLRDASRDAMRWRCPSSATSASGIRCASRRPRGSATAT